MAVRTIVVPVVNSPAGRRAIELAKKEAGPEGQVVLVGTAVVDDHLLEHVEAVKALLERLEKELAEEGVQCRTEWLVGESLGEATLAVAEELEADLIVTSLRRRTPLGKALLGSFEQEILLEAKCLVLCVPAGLG
jgi:nucleotide-binding universal stress UspA family protein